MDNGICKPGGISFFWLWIVLTCFVFLNFMGEAACLGAQGEQKPDPVVFTFGAGPTEGGNFAEAKEKAISEAMRKGVEIYLIRRLRTQGVSNHFEQLIEEVIPRAREVIEHFQILKETKGPDSYRIFVRLKLNERLVEERLRELNILKVEGSPLEVLFLVSESKDGRVSYWWKDPMEASSPSSTELACIQAFQHYGFHPVNRALSVPERMPPAEMRAPVLSSEEIFQWGDLYSADVVIYGGSQISGDREMAATLDAYLVENHLRVAHMSQTLVSKESLLDRQVLLENLGELMGRLAERLVPEIDRSTGEHALKISKFTVKVEGLRGLREFRTFQEYLRTKVPGVRSVRQTRIGPKTLSMAVEFTGDQGEFSRVLLERQDLPVHLDLKDSVEQEVTFFVPHGEEGSGSD